MHRWPRINMCTARQWTTRSLASRATNGPEKHGRVTDKPPPPDGVGQAATACYSPALPQHKVHANHARTCNKFGPPLHICLLQPVILRYMFSRCLFANPKSWDWNDSLVQILPLFALHSLTLWMEGLPVRFAKYAMHKVPDRFTPPAQCTRSRPGGALEATASASSANTS